jgi:hypothetical protein
MVFFPFSTETETDFDMANFKKAYDLVLGGLFDKQFGLTDEDDNQKIQEALKYIHEIVKGLIEQRQEVAKKVGKQTETRDLFTIMVEDNDPETGEPFTHETVGEQQLMDLKQEHERFVKSRLFLSLMWHFTDLYDNDNLPNRWLSHYRYWHSLGCFQSSSNTSNAKPSSARNRHGTSRSSPDS